MGAINLSLSQEKKNQNSFKLFWIFISKMFMELK